MATFIEIAVNEIKDTYLVHITAYKPLLNSVKKPEYFAPQYTSPT